MDCYLPHREVPGADSTIIFNRARGFIEETSQLRKNKNDLVLLLDGYTGHILYRTLKLFRDNRVLVVALPSQSTHELQPLDVTVLGAYKSFLQEQIHIAS